jgi:hypothetical protein
MIPSPEKRHMVSCCNENVIDVYKTQSRRIQRDLKDESPYTKFFKTDEFGVYYFATKVNGEAFGKISYSSTSIFSPPDIEFLNPCFKKYKDSCGLQWTPVMTLRCFLESVMSSDGFDEFSIILNNEVNEVDDMFPGFFKRK